MNLAREWCEFGKMYAAMTEMGESCHLITNATGHYCVIRNPAEFECDNGLIQTTLDIGTVESEWFESPYEAIKFQYFEHFLEIETEQIDIDLPPALYDRLCELADENDVTVDEQLVDMITSYLEEIDECECNCPCCGP